VYVGTTDSLLCRVVTGLDGCMWMEPRPIFLVNYYNYINQEGQNSRKKIISGSPIQRVCRPEFSAPEL